MRSVSASQLLSFWEEGLPQSPRDRAIGLLAAWSDVPPDAVASWPVGQLDAGLLELRESLFGPDFTAVTGCPGCAERVELTFRASDVRLKQPPESSEEVELRVGEFTVRFRLPRSTDLACIAPTSDVDEARLLLLALCTRGAWHREGPVESDRLPGHVVSAVSDEMARLDPQADVRFALRCPACGREWHSCFDIASFFWTEIHSWAQRILRDVHTLASVYHWREADILSMSAWRRQTYLELVGG